MFAKTTIAAGILAASLAFVPEAATAKTTVNVGIGGWGGGYYCGGHRRHCGWGNNWHYGWRHHHYYRHHYYRPHVVYYYGGYNTGYYRPGLARVSCGEAKLILRDRGYGRIVATDCSGRYLTFRARRGGHSYVLRVNARSGGVVVLARR